MGDLAAVVLEAARKEKELEKQGNGLLKDDNTKVTGSSSRSNGDITGKQEMANGASHASADSNGDTGNGHLQPPFEWHRNGMTDSPEPLNTPKDDYIEPSSSKQNGSGSVPSVNGANPAKKSQPAVRSREPSWSGQPGKGKNAKRSSSSSTSQFFSKQVNPSSNRRQAPRYDRKGSTTSMARRNNYYTSQSNNNSDDGENGRLQSHDYGAGSHQKKEGSGDSKGSGPADNAAVAAFLRGKKEGGEQHQSSPMRGPFSRMESSRGQSMLDRDTKERKSSAGSMGANGEASRKSSTGEQQTSSRRQSMTGPSLGRRLGEWTGLVQEESEGEEEEADVRGRQATETVTPDGVVQASPQPIQQSIDDSERRPSGMNGHAGPLERQGKGGGFPFYRSPSRQATGKSQGSSRAEQSVPNSQSQGQLDGAAAGGSGETSGQEGNLKTAVAARPSTQRSNTRWQALRQRIKQEKKPDDFDKSLTGQELMTDLATGLMSVMMLKMAFDRDEHNQHRIPVLLNYLKLRITDSIYPFHNTHAIFRIELEYGDGLLKWVIYRELRDFVNLHTHYRVANVKSSLDKFPPFPKVSIPYFNYLKKESREKGGQAPGKAEFARMQREALETYILKLIRSVMFRPEANRLCKFLELSAMSIALATKGGTQGKQGYLRIMSSGASRQGRPGFHPLDIKKRHTPKWFIVRESYILAANEAYDSGIWDVFFIDSDFEIQRPKRLYRQGIGLFASDMQKTFGKEHEPEDLPESADTIQGREGIRGGVIGDPNDPSTTNLAKDDPKYLKNASAHTFYIKNSERKIKLVAKSERQMDQFIASIEKMVEKSIWAGKNRFNSFAPIRMNVAAQWLVDGRDYYWNLSRAILLAKERIYIHDWWLSPELYLRRPPAENGRWRLDRLLQKKAEEGVQIFVIVYREVSNDFTPVDSGYTKHRLLDLHKNIMIQRSPNHGSTKTLLWSHHEKMCVIDETIAFMGGLDLCFGRWDTPGHSLVDDGPAVKDDLDLPENKANGHERGPSQIWPGKDYANSRISDYYQLDKPFEDMYDRNKTPREPWHDIGLQIIGQPARDLCRHFVQRWNLLLRTKNHTRFMPFLLPPPDFNSRELADLQLAGTCEAQICRSAGPWSLGTPNKVEHSIQTAYIKAIQLSDHFVYIENQFFITSTVVGGTAIENNIGNALVARIQQAHEERTPWRAVIVMPLEPGYPMPVDQPDAGSVRLIMECQFNSICRGEHSIFARLRRDGIDPNEYITFYGLRSWARMKDGTLATSGIYIHAKCMVVDDRVAIIGSANINERSQRGDRDSELACIIRDTDMIDSTMAGKPYKVGRFAHTLRVRLMREHLGVDVDALESEEANMDLLNREPVADEDDLEEWDPQNEQAEGGDATVTHEKSHHVRAGETAKKAGELVSETLKGATEAVGMGTERALPNIDADAAETLDPKKHTPRTALTEEGKATEGDRIVTGEKDGKGFASTVVPTLEEKAIAEPRPQDGGHGAKRPRGDKDEAPTHLQPAHSDEGRDDVNEGDDMDDLSKTRDEEFTQNTSNISDTRQLAKQEPSTDDANSTPEDIKDAHSKDRKHDELRDLEDKEKDHRQQHRHTRLTSNATSPSARSDSPSGKSRGRSGSEATKNTGKGNKSNEQAANSNKANDTIRKSLAGKMSAYSLPTPAPKIDAKKFADPLIDSFYKDVWMAAAVRNTQIFRKVFRCTPDDLVTTWAMMKEWAAWGKRHERPVRSDNSTDTLAGGPGAPPPPDEEGSSNGGHTRSPTEGGHVDVDTMKKKAKTIMEEAFSEEEIEQMVKLLEETTGHLVLFPTRFLEGESAGQNFLWSKDRIPPIAIYN